MNFKRFIPVIFIAALFSACVENDRSMGEDLVLDDYLLNVELRQFDLPLTNKVCDSVQSISEISSLVGYFYDPDYGLKFSSCAMNILPYSDSTDFGVDPKLKSAYINLKIDSVKLLNKDIDGFRQNITLYKMLTDLDSTKETCNSIKPSDYSMVPISKSDPVICGDGILRINLTDEFAEELLTVKREEFEDMDLFKKKIKGIYITTDVPSDQLTGGRFNYISLNSSVLYLNYILNNPEKKIKDLDTTESFAIGYFKSYNFFNTNSKHLENEHPEDKLYIESLDGIKAHLNAKDFRDMLDEEWLKKEGLENKYIVIANAQVILPYDEPEDYDAFNNEYPKMIDAFQKEYKADGSYNYYQPLKEINTAVNKGEMNRSRMEYSLDITSYCQDIVNKKYEDIDEGDDLWLAPIIFHTDEYDNVTTFYFDNRSYNRIMLNGPASRRHPVIKIAYAILN